MTILRATLVLLGLLGFASARPAAAADLEAVWSRNFGPVGTPGLTTAKAKKIVRDNAGNVYVAGDYKGGTMALGSGSVSPWSQNSDGFVAKLGPDGTVLWANNIGGPGATMSAQDIALDSANNVLVAGGFSSGSLTDGQANLTSGSVQDAIVLKYDTDGSLVWSRNIGHNGTAAQLTAVAVDSADNVIVAGTFQNSDLGSLPRRSFLDAFVRRYDADGTYLNQTQLWGSTSMITPTSLATRGTDIYVGGHYYFGAMNDPSLPMSGNGTNSFMLRYDAGLANTWRQAIVGNNVAATGIAVDGTGKVILVGSFSNGNLTTPALDLATGGSTGFVIKATPVDAETSSFDWIKAFGSTTAETYIEDVGVDAVANVHVTGSVQVIDWGGGMPVTTSSLLAASLSPTDGATTWSTTIGGTGGNASGTGIAIGAGGDLILAGSMSGTLATPSLTAVASIDALVMCYTPHYTLTAARAGTGSGTVTADSGGLACGTTCTARYVAGASVTLTATPTNGSTFAGWSGDCSGAAATVAVTMSATRTCTAAFSPGQTPVPATPAPSTPTPPTPAPTIVNLPLATGGSGAGTLALAAALGNPGPDAVITVTLASGAPLPDWLVFDRATLSFSFKVPIPDTMPIQATAADTRAARPAPPTLVYPPGVVAQSLSLALTIDGIPYVFNLDFQAPRNPTALTALSYSAAGRSGDGASGRPALSWDGGQVLFETAANNLATITGSDTKVARYHGLSGNRDLLSQAAGLGGGIATVLVGPATAPAVSANGAYGVFAAPAPAGTLRQIYRTGLGHPRVAQNEAVTPAAVMVSTTVAGAPANAAADRPAISENGDFVAFESAATNLGWNDGGIQVWRKTMAGGAVVLVSANAQGGAGNGASRNVSLSWDGRFATFESTATNLVPGATGRQVYLKDIATGAIIAIGVGTTPRIDARATSVVFAAQIDGIWQIRRFDTATRRLTTLTTGSADADQPSLSADGRFVAWRAGADNGFTQIWVRDVFRSVDALVSQTATGTPGGGSSYDPALSGDGASIAFGSQARDLVNGRPLPGQIHLAGNPLALPARTGHWYVPSGGNQAWAIERWGDRAYVANLAYRKDGPASWVAGLCTFVDLGCKGTLNPGPLALATWFPVEGTQAVASLNGAANQPLQFYPVLGTTTTAMPGLPQSGWWYDPANTGSGIFLQLATQTAADGATSHTAHLSLLGQDTVWYAAEGTLGSDLSLEGTLYRYAGGAPVGQLSGSPTPSATAIGQYRLTFTANDRATLHLPDGSIRNLVRFRF